MGAHTEICQVDGCEKPTVGRGYCRMHYQRWWHSGEPGDVLSRSERLAPVSVGGLDHYRCTLCGLVQPPEAFALAKGTRSGRRYQCRTCQRAAEKARDKSHRPTVKPEYRRAVQLRLKYKITLADYEAMLAAQGGVCAICGNAPDWNRPGHVPLVVDHCHTVGRVRGLLCHGCNQALGLMRDDPGRLRKAANYVERGREADG